MGFWKKRSGSGHDGDSKDTDSTHVPTQPETAATRVTGSGPAATPGGVGGNAGVSVTGQNLVSRFGGSGQTPVGTAPSTSSASRPPYQNPLSGQNSQSGGISSGGAPAQFAQSSAQHQGSAQNQGSAQGQGTSPSSPSASGSSTIALGHSPAGSGHVSNQQEPAPYRTSSPPYAAQSGNSTTRAEPSRYGGSTPPSGSGPVTGAAGSGGQPPGQKQDLTGVGAHVDVSRRPAASEPESRSMGSSAEQSERSVAASNPRSHLEMSAQDVQNFYIQKYGTIRSALSVGTLIQGRLTFDNPVRIDGKLQGEIQGAVVIIGPTGEIDARIQVATLVILGHVQGSVRATECVEILKGGSFQGELSTPQLVLQEGGRLDGRCMMIREANREQNRAEPAKEPGHQRSEPVKTSFAPEPTKSSLASEPAKSLGAPEPATGNPAATQPATAERPGAGVVPPAEQESKDTGRDDGAAEPARSLAGGWMSGVRASPDAPSAPEAGGSRLSLKDLSPELAGRSQQTPPARASESASSARPAEQKAEERVEAKSPTAKSGEEIAKSGEERDKSERGGTERDKEKEKESGKDGDAGSSKEKVSASSTPPALPSVAAKPNAGTEPAASSRSADRMQSIYTSDSGKKSDQQSLPGGRAPGMTSSASQTLNAIRAMTSGGASAESTPQSATVRAEAPKPLIDSGGRANPEQRSGPGTRELGGAVVGQGLRRSERPEDAPSDERDKADKAKDDTAPGGNATRPRS